MLTKEGIHTSVLMCYSMNRGQPYVEINHRGHHIDQHPTHTSVVRITRWVRDALIRRRGRVWAWPDGWVYEEHKGPSLPLAARQLLDAVGGLEEAEHDQDVLDAANVMEKLLVGTEGEL